VSRKIAVTGATGQVSTALINELKRADGVSLRAIVHDPAKAEELQDQGLEVVVGDLDNPRTLAGAFDDVDGLWALAPMGELAPSQNMNVLWAARAAGVRYVVRLSAIGAAHDAPTRNGRLHALSDAELRASGLPWTILKPHFYMQNLLASAGSIAGEGVFHLAMGDGRLGMVDVLDVAAAAARILIEPDKHVGQTYTLTGPDAINFHEVAEALSATAGKTIRYIPVDARALVASLESYGLPVWVVDALAEYNAAYSTGWGDLTTPAVREITGRAPRSINDFARDHASAFGAISTPV
jgi:uncharacterized protein YbjT (DUF2867 family)